MSRKDLEDVTKFAHDKNLTQEPFIKVCKMWKNSNQK